MSRFPFSCASLLTILAVTQLLTAQDTSQVTVPGSPPKTTKQPADPAAVKPKPLLQIVAPTNYQSSTVQQLVKGLESEGVARTADVKIEDVDPFDFFVVTLTFRADEPFQNLKQLIDGMRSLGVTKISLTAAPERTSYNSATVRVNANAPHEQAQRLLDFLAKQSHVKLAFEVVGAPLPVRESQKSSAEAAGSTSSASDPMVKLFRLQHVRAEEVGDFLKQLYKSPSVEFGAVRSSNSLVVRGEESLLSEIEALVVRLDETTTPDDKSPGTGSSKMPANPNATGKKPADFRVTTSPGQRILAGAGGGSAEKWKKLYEEAEQRAAAIARQLRELQARGSAKEVHLAELRTQLRAAVADAFSARQSAQFAELAELQSRTGQIQQTLSMRSTLKDQIIDRRVEDLLNPALKWDSDGQAQPNEIPGPSGSQEPKSTGRLPGKSRAATTSPTTPKNRLNESGTPLSDVVRAFNEKYASHPIGKNQPPLTDDEVVAAIRWAAGREARVQGNGSFQVFAAVAQNRLMPPNLQLEVSTNVDLPDNSRLLKWSIWLSHRHPVDQKMVGAVLLREQHIHWQSLDGTIKELAPVKSDSKDPNARPLAAAIQAFNAQHQADSIGKDQPPLTEDEVIAAIHNWETKSMEADVTRAEFDAFHAIANTHVLPANSEFEVIKGFQPNDNFEFEAWSVRIRMPRQSKPGWTYAFTIRDRLIRSRRIDNREISWGPAGANGIQAGMLFDPRSEQYTLGQKIQPRFFFRNVGSQQMSVAFPRLMTHSYYDELRAVDATGRDIPVAQDKGVSGPVGWIQMPLNPGHQHEIAGRTIVVGDIPREESVETVIRAQPGQECRIRFTVPNYGERDSLPLETGEVQFTLK